MGAKNVVIKGQHHTDDRETVDDYILLENGDHFWLKEPYIKTDRVNGTGDTFSAVIAAEIAKGNTVEAAIRTAKKWSTFQLLILFKLDINLVQLITGPANRLN